MDKNGYRVRQRDALFASIETYKLRIFLPNGGLPVAANKKDFKFKLQF